MPVLEEIERGNDYLPTGRILPHDEITKGLKDGRFVSAFHNISRHYRCTVEPMTITDRETGLAIVYENCPELSYRLILNGGLDDFICLET